MTKVLIVDQFDGPFDLKANPRTFEGLITEVSEDWQRRDVEARAKWGHGLWNRPVVKEVGEDFHAPQCTTVFRANAEGLAEAWLRNWDSSG